VLLHEVLGHVGDAVAGNRRFDLSVRGVEGQLPVDPNAKLLPALASESIADATPDVGADLDTRSLTYEELAAALRITPIRKKPGSRNDGRVVLPSACHIYAAPQSQ
jgi:hypothetical protein